jgi:phage/plasmid-associated DNA primase
MTSKLAEDTDSIEYWGKCMQEDPPQLDTSDAMLTVNIQQIKGLANPEFQNLKPRSAKRGDARKTKKGAYEIYRWCEEKSKDKFLVVDENLYYRCYEGFSYKKISGQDLSRRLVKIADELGDEDTKKDIVDVGTVKILKAFMTLAKTMKRREIYEKFKQFIAFKNGIFNIYDGSLYKDMNSLLMRINNTEEVICLLEIQASYIPGSERMETPIWAEFLKTITGDVKSQKNRIMEMICILMMGSWHVKKLFVCADAPNSGKSTLAEFMCSLFPDGTVGRKDIHELGKRFATGDIADCAINLAMDVSSEALPQKAVGSIKTLTGDRGSEAERKYKPSVVNECTCKLVVGTNWPLIPVASDQAYFNRLEIIPFQHTIPDTDSKMDQYECLQVEKDIIASICIDKAKLLIDNNFVMTDDCTAEMMKSAWIEQAYNAKNPEMRNVLKAYQITGQYEDYIISDDFAKEYIRVTGRQRATNSISRELRNLIETKTGKRFSGESTKRFGDKTMNIIRGIRHIEEKKDE